jgi:two-component system OmpR family sensor kinase
LKAHDKKHFIKSFIIFFISLEILNIIVFNFYYREQKSVLLNSIFSKLNTYNYNFENQNISMDIEPFSKDKEKYKLYLNENEIYAYFDLLNSETNLLKLIYDHKLFEKELNDKFIKTMGLFVIVTIILLTYSFFYSFYTLKPYRSSIRLLERFLKDIIHDLNTPISSILINISILKKTYNLDAVKRMELSSKTISNLYKNLELYITNSKFNFNRLDLNPIIKDRIDYFKKLYPDLNFNVEDKKFVVNTNEIGVVRVLDNIISNSCKYNKKNGFVNISFQDNKIIIEDTGIGIKHPEKVFQRFYKESDRGMGIGLNIVSKIAEELEINIDLQSELDKGTKLTLEFKEVDKDD